MEIDKNDHSERTAPMTVGKWFWTIVLTMIPIVNFIVLIIWAVSSNTNVNKQNYARAMWLWYAVAVVLGFILTIAGITFIADFFKNIIPKP